MSTILDELLVRIGLDTKDFPSKSSEVKQQLEGIEQAGEGAEEGISGIGKASAETADIFTGLVGKLGGFLAALGGAIAIKDFVRNTIETNTHLNYLAKNLGMSVQSLGAWGTVAREFGGTAQGLQNTLSGLSREATNFAITGQSNLLPFLARMGVAFDQNHPEKMLEGIAAWVDRTQTPSNRPALHNWLAMMGIDEGTINAMLGGKNPLDQKLAEAAPVQATTKEAQSAADATQKLVMLAATISKAGMDTLQPFLEGLDKILPSVQTEFLKLDTVLSDDVPKIASNLKLLGDALSDVVNGKSPMADLRKMQPVYAPAGDDGNGMILGMPAFNPPANLTPLQGVGKSKMDIQAAIIATAKKLGYTDEQIDLAMALAQQESGLRQFGANGQVLKGPGDLFHQRAEGVFQVLPNTAIGKYGLNPEDTGENIMAGLRYLLEGFQKYPGDTEAALRYYYSGTGKSSDRPARFGMPSPNAYARSVMAGAGMAPRNVTINTGDVNIVTSATDSKGIAASIKKELQKLEERGMDWISIVGQANSP